MSTGTDVILCVIPAMTRVAWCRLYPNLGGRKTPPVGDDKHDFKKGLKGRLVVFVAVVGFGLIGEWLLLLLQRPMPLPPLKLTILIIVAAMKVSSSRAKQKILRAKYN